MTVTAETRERGELPLSGASLTDLLISVLAKDKAFRFRAKGWSMSPFVKDADVITVSPLRGREPRTGEIVAFLHPKSGRAAVHRVVRAAPGTFLLRGDNTSDAEGPLAAERILGVVTEVVRDGKKVKGVQGCGARLIAFFSRTGGLVRGLGLLRKLARRSAKERP
ncbi:MAG: S24/S26 family peptidase [Candidatus Aminicenantes bacterium RBG_16_66_30]